MRLHSASSLASARLMLPPFIPIILLFVPMVLDACAIAAEGLPFAEDSLDEAFVLATISPVLYLLLGVANFADSLWDRFGRVRSWLATGGMMAFCGLILSLMDSATPAGSVPLEAISYGYGFALSAGAFLPMAVMRRHVMPAPLFRGGVDFDQC